MGLKTVNARMGEKISPTMNWTCHEPYSFVVNIALCKRCGKDGNCKYTKLLKKSILILMPNISFSWRHVARGFVVKCL
jgi:rRNA maturation endonuclease Nob1